MMINPDYQLRTVKARKSGSAFTTRGVEYRVGEDGKARPVINKAGRKKKQKIQRKARKKNRR